MTMKSVYKVALLAVAAGVFTLVSCGDKGGKEDAVVLAPHIDEAVKIVFAETDYETAKLASIEFTEGGYAIVEKIGIKGSGIARKKVASYVDVLGYTYSNGVYNVNTFGKVKLNGKKVSINDGSEYTVTTPGRSVPTTLNPLLKSWKVSRAILSVKGGDFGSTGIGKTFNGFSIKEITEYIASNGVTVPEGLSSLVVKDITFTGQGTFVINFTSGDPYVGSWKLSGTSFSYNLSNSDGDSILNGSANGSIDLSKDGKSCEVEIKGEFTAGGAKYTTEVELELTAS